MKLELHFQRKTNAFKRLFAAIGCATIITMLIPAQALPSTEDSDLQKQVTELREKLEQLEKQLADGEQQKQAPAREKVQLSGFTQVRYTDKEGAAGNFNIPRARLKIFSQVTDRSALTLLIEGAGKDGKVELRDAYLDRRLSLKSNCYIRAGQAKTPIMYEVLESNTVLLPPERTAVSRAMFPGERDIGLLLRSLTSGKLTFDFGLANGQGRNTSDKNSRKNILGRAVLSTSNGTAYVGYYDGDFVDAGGTTTDRTRFAVGTEQTLGQTGVRAEYVSGKNLGRDVAGWYAQVAVPVKQANTLFVRYDVYDEDRDAADTTFTRTTFGLAHHLNDKTRLTAAYESRSADAGFANLSNDGEAAAGDVFMLQYQVKY